MPTILRNLTKGQFSVRKLEIYFYDLCFPSTLGTFQQLFLRCFPEHCVKRVGPHFSVTFNEIVPRKHIVTDWIIFLLKTSPMCCISRLYFISDLMWHGCDLPCWLEWPPSLIMKQKVSHATQWLRDRLLWWLMNFLGQLGIGYVELTAKVATTPGLARASMS